MDEPAKRKLNRLIWAGRVRVALPILAVLAVAACVIIFFFPAEEKAIQQRSLAATVDHWSQEQTDLGGGRLVLWLTLENGEQVMATADGQGRAPATGQSITVLEQSLESGRIRYVWRR